MKPSAASDCTKSSIVSATVAGLPMNDCRPVTSMISSRMREPLGLGELPPLARRSASGSRCMRTLARPWATVFSPTTGSTSGSGPSGS